MKTVKMKVQAQRKFAQGAFVPPSPMFTEPRRMTILNRPVDNSVKVMSNNIPAKNMLDAITFSHPGMHLHSPRVLLERLSSTDYKAPSKESTHKKNTRKSIKKNKLKQQNIAPSERVLRSMRVASPGAISDDMPLTYHLKKRPPKPNVIPKKNKCTNTNYTENHTRELTTSKKRKSSRLPDIPPTDRILRISNRSSACGSCDVTVPAKNQQAAKRNKNANTNGIKKSKHEGPDVGSIRCKPIEKLLELSQLPEQPAPRAQGTSADANVGKQQKSNTGNIVPSTSTCIIDTHTASLTNPVVQLPLLSNLCEPTPSTSGSNINKNTASTKNNATSNEPMPSTSSEYDFENVPEEEESLRNRKPSECGLSEAGFYEVPVYHPTVKQFTDPLSFYNKIAPEASAFGFCKVIPPKMFQPACNLNGLDRLVVSNQYVSRLYNRFGEGTKEMCTIRSYMASHGIFAKTPLIDGLEVNLPQIFTLVQRYGGFNEVTRKNKWQKVAEEMSLPKLSNPDIKLDRIYLKYMLPYEILTNEERVNLRKSIEKCWLEEYQEMNQRARNPLQVKKMYDGQKRASSPKNVNEKTAPDPEKQKLQNMKKIICDIEDCVKPGRSMPLSVFKKINESANQVYLKKKRTIDAIENFYWDAVLNAKDHIVVHTASVDTSDRDIGFSTEEGVSMFNHPWNLKHVRNNERNMLRSLGPLVPINKPIVHFGMLFSSNCWHRDPHGLPWLEYLHTGKEKIWYGVPANQSEKFRKAMEKICPLYVQNKKVWLSSDIAMIPPDLLAKHGVTLFREVQSKGEFIFIFPKAYTSSICTGYSISESVYFAMEPWTYVVANIVKELRNSWEPMMFAPEHLFIALIRDNSVPIDVVKRIYPEFKRIINEEITCRSALLDLGVVESFSSRKDDIWRGKEEEECDVCRRPLYISKVKGSISCTPIAPICPQDAKRILRTAQVETHLRLVIMISNLQIKEILTLADLRIASSTNN
ncbi:protein Jumonji [Bicyclus anynana]|uniref:Protein Jumonji n=1 Tax=Bicyclus anynana TaxID=110368 RepID=A0A6J1NCD2_BICAN|nr:protein Jumonji [Bicyclus anynana]